MAADWKTTAERLCRAVCPDVADEPIYIVDFAEIREWEPRLHGGKVVGWTHELADLLLSDWLSTNGRWQGRGFGTVIHAEQMTLQDLLGVTLHELAHYLTFANPVAASADDTEADRTREIELGQAALSIIPDRWEAAKPPVNPPPWDQHEADFVRASCILAHRTEGVIESVRPRHLSFARNYYRPPFNENTFLASLTDELSDPRPIRDILTTEPPEEFSELYSMATDWFTAEAET